MAQDLPEDHRKDRTADNPSHRNNNKKPTTEQAIRLQKEKEEEEELTSELLYLFK